MLSDEPIPERSLDLRRLTAELSLRFQRALTRSITYKLTSPTQVAVKTPLCRSLTLSSTLFANVGLPS